MVTLCDAQHVHSRVLRLNPAFFFPLYISKAAPASGLHNLKCIGHVHVCVHVYWDEHWLILCIPKSNYPLWPGDRARSMSKRKKLVTDENGTDKNHYICREWRRGRNEKNTEVFQIWVTVFHSSICFWESDKTIIEINRQLWKPDATNTHEPVRNSENRCF